MHHKLQCMPRLSGECRLAGLGGGTHIDPRTTNACPWWCVAPTRSTMWRPAMCRLGMSGCNAQMQLAWRSIHNADMMAYTMHNCMPLCSQCNMVRHMPPTAHGMMQYPSPAGSGGPEHGPLLWPPVSVALVPASLFAWCGHCVLKWDMLCTRM